MRYTSSGMRLPLVLAFVGGASLLADAPPQKPQLADILKASGAYLLDYSQKIAVTAEEDYVQRDITTSSAPRRLQSDVVLVGIGNGVVIGYRDTFAVDASKIRERDDRLMKLFQRANPADGQEAATAIQEQAAHYYLTPNLRTLDTPALVFEFLRESAQPQSEFAIESIKTVDGVQVAIVKFTERPTSRILPTPEGSKTSGRFWIEVATGTVRQTELTVDHRAFFRFHVSTKFANDAGVGLWVPVEVLQDVEVRRPATSSHSNMGSGGQLSARQAFEGRARYSKYRRLAS